MDKKKALGRGMASLIPDPSLLNEEATPPKTYFYCDIENIVPNKSQPRKKFNDESLQELADSIREKGILQPILVRRLSEFKFELIAGERRWRAAQKAGLMQVPVIVRESTTQSALEEALIENIQREDLNPIEEALAYQGLIEEHGYTQEEIAKKIGKQRSTLANSLRLLTLSKAILDLILDRKISSGHAKALLSIEDKEKREEVAMLIVEKGLSVRQVEAFAKSKVYQVGAYERKMPDPYIATLEQELSQHFKAKVRILHGGKKGKIEVEYFGESELNRIIAMFKA